MPGTPPSTLREPLSSDFRWWFEDFTQVPSRGATSFVSLMRIHVTVGVSLLLYGYIVPAVEKHAVASGCPFICRWTLDVYYGLHRVPPKLVFQP